MASHVRSATEALVIALQDQVTPHTQLVPNSDYYEVKKTPSLVVIGPKIVENKSKRISEKLQDINIQNLAYEERRWPSYYHLDFEFLLTAKTGAELLDLIGRTTVFFIDNTSVAVDSSVFNIVELIPIGGLDRPNLSNLRQASGKYRIEDVTVFGDLVTNGKLVLDREFRLRDRTTGDLEAIKIFRHENE